MWFTETSGPPILILSVIAAIYFIAWYGNRRTLYLVIIGILALLSVAIYVTEKMIVTDLEQVEDGIIGVTKAFQQRDVEKTLSYFAENTRAEYGAVIEYGLKRVEVLDLRLKDIQIEMKNQDTRAISRFRANGTILLDSTTQHEQPSRWEVTWEKQAGEWKIIKAVPLHLATGEPMSLW